MTSATRSQLWKLTNIYYHVQINFISLPRWSTVTVPYSGKLATQSNITPLGIMPIYLLIQNLSHFFSRAKQSHSIGTSEAKTRLCLYWMYRRSRGSQVFLLFNHWLLCVYTHVTFMGYHWIMCLNFDIIYSKEAHSIANRLADSLTNKSIK